MHWLLTTKADLPAERLDRLLRDLGAQMPEGAAPVPLDKGEQTVEVEGPRDLPARARARPEVLAVHPSSELTLYDR